MTINARPLFGGAAAAILVLPLANSALAAASVPPSSTEGTTTANPQPTTTTTTTSPTTTTTTTTTATTTTTTPTTTSQPNSATTVPTPGEVDPVPTTIEPPVTAPPTPIAPAPRNVIVRPDRIEYILATIRHMESRNNYTIPPNKGGASGAYQYIDSTWNGYAGYAQAWQAPWWIQDERAAADVEGILRAWGNDVSMVPIIWYYPKAARNPALLDVVPIPSAGNVLTIREYQLRWLNAFSYISGQPLPERIFGGTPDLQLLSGIPPVVNKNPISPLEVAFPLLGPSALASSPECGDTECTAVPAIVYGTKLQPVLVAADGVVTDVVFSDPITGAVTVTITDAFGRRFLYSGFNDDNPGTNDGEAPDHLRLTEAATVGNTVRAGEILGFLGDSDPMPDDGTADESAATDDVMDDTAATENDAPDEEPGNQIWPHLRLAITAYDGTPINADKPVAVSLYRQTCTTGIGQWSVAPHPDLIDEPMKGLTISAGPDRGAWAITSLGQVNAIGDAALLGPTDACQWAPDESYGPGAGGNYVVPEGWNDDIDLPSYILIAAALAGDGAGVVTPLPRG